MKPNPLPCLPIDSAKKEPSEDRLGRVDFCRKLARILAKGHSEGSLVVALYGDWGVGKTTVKNFTKYFLEEDFSLKGRVIEFEPWQWSGRSEILNAFFSHVGRALGAKNYQKIAKKWRQLAAKLGLVTPMLREGKNWLPLLLLLFAGTGLLTPIFGQRAELAQAICAVIGVAFALCVLGAETMAASAGAYFEGLHNRPPEKIRDELGDLLNACDQPLVIVIDDIDRLERSEIRQVVQLVKSVANLPNVVFLLLFQRDVVAGALEEIAGSGKGDDFMEKIIQAGFHIPEPTAGRILNLLEEEIQTIRKNAVFGEKWDEVRWQNYVRQPLAVFFLNVRNVVRFIGSLQVYVEQHSHNNRLEVNPIDLVVLETLRMFEPTVFEKLADVPFVGQGWTLDLLYGKPEKAAEKRELEVERLAALATGEARSSVQALLKILFPQLSEGRATRVNEESYWDSELRICHKNHYRRYFDLHLSTDRASSREFTNLVEASSSAQETAKQFDVLSQKGLLSDVIIRFSPHLDKIDVRHLGNFVLGLFNASLQLDRDMWDNALSNAETLVEECLERIPDKSSRLKMIQEALLATNAVDVPVGLISRFEKNLGHNLNPQHLVFDQNEVDILKREAVRLIKSAASDDRLWTSFWLPMHLSCWANWASQSEPSNWLVSKITNGRLAIELLLKWMGQSRETSSAGTQIVSILNAETLDKMFGLDALNRLIKQSIFDLNDPTIRDAIELLEMAIQYKAEGKPISQLRSSRSTWNR